MGEPERLKTTAILSPDLVPLSDKPVYVTGDDGLPARVSGAWALRKHHYLSNYCGITTGGVGKKIPVVYLDVMAGPGRTDLSAPPLLEAAGTPRAPAAGKLPAGALARRDDPASRNGAVQQSGQLVGVALAPPEPSPPVHAEGLLPRKAPAAPGAATVWPGGQPQLAGPAVQDQALPPLEEKASVWPSLGGGPTTYEPRVRQGAQQPAAPIAGPVTAAPEVAAPAAAPDFSDWPQAQPAPKAQPAAQRAEPLPEDLEALFLQRAERGLERGICERYLMGLQEIASDASRNERAQTARILRARCYDARVRPDLSEIEYRRYLEVWPKGRHSDEARKAVIE